MRNIIVIFIFAVCLAGMANYASADPVESYLEVYTQVQEINDGGYLWVRGTPYTIFSDDGKKTKWVRNDSGKDLVTLPPGKYRIVLDGMDKNQGLGAIVEEGKLTEVHLM